MSRNEVLTQNTLEDQEAANNMASVLAQMESSQSLYFVKTLSTTALHNPPSNRIAKLSLPQEFVEEHREKFNSSVTLRTQTSSGRPSERSWPANAFVSPTLEGQIVDGWSDFVTDNLLQKGDSVIFHLREDAQSEFVVHFFRGPRGAPYFPDHGDDEDDESSEEEKGENRNNLHSGNHPNSAVQSTGDGRELHPSFTKELAASHILKSSGEFNTAQFEIPAQFVRAYGHHIHDPVKLQGIHENSRNYVVHCRRRPKNFFKIYFAPAEWSLFVRDNSLEKGHKLQFTLMADSYFLVRKISD